MAPLDEPALAAADTDRARVGAAAMLPAAAPGARDCLWRELLPRLTVAAVVAMRSPGTSRAEVWLLLTFPLGRAQGGASGAASLQRERVRRRAALAAELSGLRAATAIEGASDDETAAALRALGDSWEGLR